MGRPGPLAVGGETPLLSADVEASQGVSSASWAVGRRSGSRDSIVVGKSRKPSSAEPRILCRLEPRGCSTYVLGGAPCGSTVKRRPSGA